VKRTSPYNWLAQLSFLRPGNADRWPRLIGPSVVLLAAAVAVAPQILHGPSCGHDFDFHLVSWFDCLNSWRHGILYPHWAPSANFGAGEPRFLFYPPLTWMLGAALGVLLPWQFVPLALTFLLLAATGLATRALAREVLPDGPATLAGCAALFSGYALFTAYERAAFGELAGGLWIPLLLLYAIRSRAPSGSVLQRAFDGSAAPLALVVAGCWLSNLPLGVMACYLLAAVVAAAALLARSWAPVLRATVAVVAGIGLASIFLLPAALEQRWVKISQATDNPGEMIENNWLLASHTDPALRDHDLELHRVSLIALSMLAVSMIGLLIFWLRRKFSLEHAAEADAESGRDLQTEDNLDWNRKKRQGTTSVVPQTPQKKHRALPPAVCSSESFLGNWLPLALIPPAILFLQLPISLPIWNLLPKLRYLQFPWRWLVVLEAPMAIFFAAVVWPVHRWLRVAVIALCAAFFLAAAAFTARSFHQPCDDQDAVAPMVNAYSAGAGFPGVGEYAPTAADNALLPSGLPDTCLLANPAIVLGVVPGDADPDAPIPAWSEDQGSCIATLPWQLDQPGHKRLRAIAPRAGFLILRLRAYPAWWITLNGRSAASLPKRADGLIAVPVTPGPVDIAVDWTATADVILGRWLSALAVLLLAGLFWLERRLSRASMPRLQ
jgi:hypothetical protein